MSKVEIFCPRCSKKGYIEIDKAVVAKSQRGIVALTLNKDTICEHSFLVYIDKNLAIRDSFLTDFTIQIPEMDIVKKNGISKVTSEDEQNIGLIKLNLSPKTLIFIFRALFLKKKVLIISDDEFLNSQFQKFFEIIFKGSFKTDIMFLLNKTYKKGNFKKDFVILHGAEIIKDKYKILDLKKNKMTIEKQIVQKFFEETESKSTIIILRNEIQKAQVLTQTILDFLEENPSKKKINITNIIEYLEKIHNVKVSKPYVYFLIEIAKKYFEVDIPLVYDSFIGFL